MICALVLAAGRSRRMGVQKLLLPVQGQPLIAHVADQVLRSPVDHVFVIVGHDADQLAQALAGRNVSLVDNPELDGEMLSSVRCGLRALPAACDAVLVALGDQPGITAELIARLVQAFRHGGKGIVLPAHGGQRGHPLVFTTRYRDEILTGYDHVGLHGLLRAHGDDVDEVEVGEPSVLEDLDRPEDYQRLVGQGTAKE